MYMTQLKTLLVQAARRTFDGDYFQSDFRGLHIDIEFPMTEQAYPGLWVDFTPTQKLHVIGIGHVEYEDIGVGHVRPYSRWAFQGNASYTITALSSLERDRLVDEMVRILAFGEENDSTSEFRQYIEDNPLLSINIDFDTIDIGGVASTPGTPWSTDDVVYETTVSVEVVGEFVSDSANGDLIRLTDIIVTPYTDPPGDPDQTW